MFLTNNSVDFNKKDTYQMLTTITDLSGLFFSNGHKTSDISQLKEEGFMHVSK